MNTYIKPLNFGAVSTKNNLILAPLAGYSHKPMRILNRKFGAGYTITEMVSVEGILRDSHKTLRYADISDAPEETSIQLFGKDSPKSFYQASKILQDLFGVRSLNINFGCPAPKVLKNGAGSRLLDEPEKIKDIINAVKDSGVAVEAKIRCGFNHDNLDPLISTLDRSDVDLII
ncbi:MAG: tRNA-dihydrouridine synthase, partial [Brevinema sp.]